MKKMINKVHLEGRVYQHDLEVRTVQNKESKAFGQEYIGGTLELAVDDDGLNVIPVRFSYVTAENSKGAKNATYEILKRLIDTNATWVSVGKDNALKLAINTSLSLNDFYNSNGELVSAKIVDGGFCTVVNELCEEGGETSRHSFELDMLITRVTYVEKDEEKHVDEDYAILKGCVFNFRNEILPVELTIKRPDGIKYFENANISDKEPLFTKVWGKINCETKVTLITEESAFGEAAVKRIERKTREWRVDGAYSQPYDFGDEAVLTADEITKGIQDREVKLAETKKRAEDARQAKAAPVAAAPIKQGTFNF